MYTENFFKSFDDFFLVFRIVIFYNVATALINKLIVYSFKLFLDIAYKFVFEKALVFAFQMNFAVANKYNSIQLFYLSVFRRIAR